MSTDTSVKTLSHWRDRLTDLRGAVTLDPLRNPIRETAHEVSVALEADRLNLDDLVGFVQTLCDEALGVRIASTRKYLGFDHIEKEDDAIDQAVQRASEALTSPSAFADYWRTRRSMLVFTAHPTFMLSGRQRAYIAKAATSGSSEADSDRQTPSGLEHHPDADISLSYEHAAALGAIERASASVSHANRAILEEARRRFPNEWRQMTPSPLSIATWVGYDMDGRKDITWRDIIKHRLQEKHRRLQWYTNRIAALGLERSAAAASIATLRARLADGLRDCADAVDAFANDTMSPNEFADAANRLTETPQPLVKISELTDLIEASLPDVDDDTAFSLLCLKADMTSFQFGMGEIHFRLNAAQVRNAARHALNISSDQDLFGRRALEEVQTLIETTEPVAVNFGSLAIEQTTAARLFIAMAQIVKHIDAEQPIRLLIAECENPVTILASVYLAKRFGVDGAVDICPLFETAYALDRSRRILDVLFSQPAYQTYAKARGRIAIQTGFSDAGRFMGQIPAVLAIERLQGHFSELIEAHGLSALTAIVFNTHGESMGRGAHPASLEDRSLYALSPWARRQFSSRGVDLIHESSYQGGDGYLLFETQGMADRVVASVLAADKAAAASPTEDGFYQNISTSLDFYRSVKARQEALFADKTYNATLSAIGLSVLPKTGSRQTKRQFEQRGDEDDSLRKIRAIPHNATLQQIGLLANIFGGIGAALSKEPDYFVDLAQNSDRFGRLMKLVARAKSLSEMKVTIAYMKLFDGSFWATRPISGQEPHLEAPCAVLGEALAEDSRFFSALQLIAKLRSDSIALTRSLENMGFSEAAAANPISLDLLHVMRIALLEHVFLLAARLPRFSPRAGYTKEDVMDMVFSLQLEEAGDILCEVFPVEAPALSDFKLAEKATYPDAGPPSYSHIHETFVDPLKKCGRLLKIISNGVSNHYGALG
ncbi:MAG: phosphoenolpyruvate carboxylase [Pseudomonadota bacterium]